MFVLFPGSFDPFTSGHKNIIDRALRIFDRVFVAVGVNSDKHYMYSVDERVAIIHQAMGDDDRVEVVSYSGMTVDLCRRLDIHCIVRGVRNSHDMEYEQTVAAVNRTLAPDIDTILLIADNEYKDISSTLEREKLLHS